MHVAYRPAGSSVYADPYDLLADAQHRIVGGDMPLSQEDLDAIGRVVDDKLNQKLSQMYTGQRALTVDGDPGVYEIGWDGDGERIRRWICSNEEWGLLRYADQLAEGNARKITDPGQAQAFKNLRVSNPGTQAASHESGQYVDPD